MGVKSQQRDSGHKMIAKHEISSATFKKNSEMSLGFMDPMKAPGNSKKRSNLLPKSPSIGAAIAHDSSIV
jgi:hypothetical protein